MSFPPIFEWVSGDSGIGAVLGTSPLRFYPFGEAPDQIIKPYAVWQIVGGVPENYINQTPDTDSFTVQVDCYAPVVSDARDVAEELQRILEDRGHIVEFGGETRDRETRLFRHMFRIDLIISR